MLRVSDATVPNRYIMPNWHCIQDEQRREAVADFMKEFGAVYVGEYTGEHADHGPIYATACEVDVAFRVLFNLICMPDDDALEQLEEEREKQFRRRLGL